MSGAGRDTAHLDWSALDRVRNREGTEDERAHVAGCAACRAELDRMEGLAQSARASSTSGGAGQIPAAVESAILAAARERAGAIRSGKLVRLPLWKRLRPLAIAASLFAGVSAVYLTYVERGSAPVDSGRLAPRSDLDAARNSTTPHAEPPAQGMPTPPPQPMAEGGKAQSVAEPMKQKETVGGDFAASPKREQVAPPRQSEAKKDAKDAPWPPPAFRFAPGEPAPPASAPAPVAKAASADQKTENETENQPDRGAGVRTEAFDKLAEAPDELDRERRMEQRAIAPVARPLEKLADSMRDERGGEGANGVGAASSAAAAGAVKSLEPASPPALQSKVAARLDHAAAPCVSAALRLGGLSTCGGTSGTDVENVAPTSSELEIELAADAGPALARIRQTFTVTEPRPSGIYATPVWAQAQALRLEGTVEARDRAEADFVDLESRIGRPGWSEWNVPAPLAGTVRLTLTFKIPAPVPSARAAGAKIVAGPECASSRPPIELAIPSDVIEFVRGSSTGARVSIFTPPGTHVENVASPSHDLTEPRLLLGGVARPSARMIIQAGRSPAAPPPLVLVLSICDERGNPPTAPAP